jgi:hypothetical protein
MNSICRATPEDVDVGSEAGSAVSLTAATTVRVRARDAGATTRRDVDDAFLAEVGERRGPAVRKAAAGVALHTAAMVAAGAVVRV